MVDTSRDVLRLRGYYRRETDSLWRVAKIYGDTINLDTTKYAGEIIWLSREDLAGYDGDVWLKFEVNDGWVSNFSDSLRFRVDNNNLPSVSIVEITTEHSDSVRISYVLRDDERDTLRIRLEYSEEVRFSWDRHPFASRYALYSDNRSGGLDTNFAIVEVDSSVLSYSLIDTSRDVLRFRGYYRRETDSPVSYTHLTLPTTSRV